MGGGHVSRPDFGMPQPDAAYPLTEFYLLAQQALEKRQLYAARPLRRAARPCPAHLPGGSRRVFTACGCPGRGLDPAALPCPDAAFIQQLQVQPDGTPAALLLTEECTRLTVAVQLLPPFVWEDPLPPLPDVPAALTLQLTMQDVMAIDTAPAALAQKLVHSTSGKCWLHHPKAETFLSERLALLQRVYK